MQIIVYTICFISFLFIFYLLPPPCELPYGGWISIDFSKYGLLAHPLAVLIAFVLAYPVSKAIQNHDSKSLFISLSILIISIGLIYFMSHKQVVTKISNGGFGDRGKNCSFRVTDLYSASIEESARNKVLIKELAVSSKDSPLSDVKIWIEKKVAISYQSFLFPRVNVVQNTYVICIHLKREFDEYFEAGWEEDGVLNIFSTLYKRSDDDSRTYYYNNLTAQQIGRIIANKLEVYVNDSGAFYFRNTPE